MKNFILIVLCLLMIHQVNAQEQITSLSPNEGDRGSFPSDFIELNGLLLFEATTESYGREIWVSTGIGTTAFLLKDINLGKNSGINTEFLKSSVILDNTLYFIANDASSLGELWKTDGTTAGTEKITTFLNYSVSELTLVDNNIYFLIKKDMLEVWKSDGTEAGTVLVIGDLPIWNKPSFQGKCNNTFIFTFQPQGTNNSRVWRSDGTTIGTFPITDEIDGNGAGSGTSELTQYIELNNEAFFVSRYHLHKTDGTLENTTTVTSLHNAGISLVDYDDVIEINGKLYFSFFQVEEKRLFVWESDGTLKGTTKIYDETSSRYFMTSNLATQDDDLVFCGTSENGGTALVHIDLSDYSTTIVKEVRESTDVPLISNICGVQPILNGAVFCSVPQDDNYEPKTIGWISGLTEATTINFPKLDSVKFVHLYNDILYFSKYSENEGIELWSSNQTETGTVLLNNINEGGYGLFSFYNPSLTPNLIRLKENLVFNADDGTIGDELWMYNGEDIVLLKDISEGEIGSYPRSFIKFNNEVYFVAYTLMTGSELWKTDGTEAGTQILQDLNGTSSSRPMNLTVHNGYLFFVAKDGNSYYLYKTDGTTVESIMNLGGSNFIKREMVSSGDLLYLTTAGMGKDLWISDGTGMGTYKVKDFATIEKLTIVDGELYFRAVESGNHDIELWKSNGTEAGTVLIKDIGDGYSSLPDDLIGLNDALFFTAYTTENGRELWKSDGTESGTFQVIDIREGTEGALQTPNYSSLNGHLYFNANDGINGNELWKTDGTESGTSIVVDINTGIEGSSPSELTYIQDFIYFNAYDNEHGIELWRTDGTETGTVLMSDILAGKKSACPTQILLLSSQLHFVAETPSDGRQIWKMDDVVGLVPIIEEVEFLVYPNPALDFLYIDVADVIEDLRVYNANGQLIKTEKMRNNRIDISKFTNGLYIVRFNLNGKSIVYKIIKQ